MPSVHDRALERLVAALEVRMRTVEAEVDHLRDWRHNLPSQLLAPIQEELHEMATAMLDLKREVAGRDEDGENRRLTMRDFWIAVGFLGAGIALAKLVPALAAIVAP